MEVWDIYLKNWKSVQKASDRIECHQTRLDQTPLRFKPGLSLGPMLMDYMMNKVNIVCLFRPS